MFCTFRNRYVPGYSASSGGKITPYLPDFDIKPCMGFFLVLMSILQFSAQSEQSLRRYSLQHFSIFHLFSRTCLSLRACYAMKERDTTKKSYIFWIVIASRLSLAKNIWPRVNNEKVTSWPDLRSPTWPPSTRMSKNSSKVNMIVFQSLIDLNNNWSGDGHGLTLAVEVGGSLRTRPPLLPTVF